MQKGSAHLFVIIAGLLLIGVVSIFSFGFIKSPLPVPTLPLKVAAIPPAYLTYQNESLGLEFQYPNKGFTAKEDTEAEFNKRGTGVDSKNVNGDFRKNFKGYVGYAPAEPLGAAVVLDSTNSFDSNPFSVWVFDNPDDLTVNSWFDKYWYYPYLWGVFDYSSKSHITLDTEATISGQMAKYKIVSYQPGSPKFIYVSKEKKMYLFRLIGESGDKVLSTFEFLK